MKEIYLSDEFIDYYTHQAEYLLDVYNMYIKKKTNPIFKIADILISFDNYYSSLIIKTINTIRPITSDEVKTLNLNLKYSSIFSHLLEGEEKYNVDDNIENIINQSNNILKNIPLFIRFGVSIDKDMEKSHIKMEKTMSGIFYNSIREMLTTYFECDEAYISDILNSIMTYYFQKKVTLRG